jgi:ferredoxin
MYIEIDSSKCQGHALCALMSDDYFALDDIGHIASTSGEVQHEDAGRARQGAEACPERVFTLS